MKKLKILIANNTLSLLAGSETWTFVLAKTLKTMGHEVSCFSPSLGIISDNLLNEGIKSFSEIDKGGIVPFSFILEEKIEHNYDFIIANHFHIVAYLRQKFPKTPIISTIHGIIHQMENGDWAPEHPATESGVNQFVSVSEEIQEKLKNEYMIDSCLIRNFFDLKQFDVGPANEKPKQFLINTNYSDRTDPVVQVVREAAVAMGARLAVIGANFIPNSKVEEAIKDSDVIFGMGRSVLEGVTAGRLGIVHGRWGTGGVINQQNIEALRHFNFSGRNSEGRLATKDELIEMINNNYNPETLSWSKNYAAREHNAIFAAEKYLRIGRELIGDEINSNAS